MEAMDFHSLTRKELQTLCKKNKIPANITNVAMADALKALEIVDGLDEIINQLAEVPRTANRTSTRRRPTKSEAGSTQPTTRARCVSRRAIAGELDQESLIETLAEPTSERRAPVVTDVVEEEMDSLDTPAVQPSGRRRVPQDSTRRKAETQTKESAQRVYGTRRSVRLLEKSLANLNLIEPKKADEIAGEKDELQRNLSETLDKEGGIIEDVQEISEDVNSGADKCLVKHAAISEESDNLDDVSAIDTQNEAPSQKADESNVQLDNVPVLDAKSETPTHRISESDIDMVKISAACGKYESPSLKIDESKAHLVENSEKAAELDDEIIDEKVSDNGLEEAVNDDAAVEVSEQVLEEATNEDVAVEISVDSFSVEVSDESNAQLGENPDNAIDETIDEKGSKKAAITEDSDKSDNSTVDVVAERNTDPNPCGAKSGDLLVVEVSNKVHELEEQVADVQESTEVGEAASAYLLKEKENTEELVKIETKELGSEFSSDSENSDDYLDQDLDGSDVSETDSDISLGSDATGKLEEQVADVHESTEVGEAASAYLLKEKENTEELVKIEAKELGLEFSSDSENSDDYLDQDLDGSDVSETDSDISLGSDATGKLEEQVADVQESTEVGEAASAYLLKEKENTEELVKIGAKELGSEFSSDSENSDDYLDQDLDGSNVSETDSDISLGFDATGKLEEQVADVQESTEVGEAASAYLLKGREDTEELVKFEAKESGMNHHEEDTLLHNTPEFVGDDASLSKMEGFGNGQDIVVAIDESSQLLEKTPAGAKQMTPCPSLVPTGEVNNTMAFQFPRPSQFTARKSSSKKQAAVQIAPQVSDINSENINNSAWKLEPTLVSMNKDKDKDVMRKAVEESFEDMSMRQMKKKLKELTISKNKKSNEVNPVEKTRSALQPLPDNCVGVGEREK
ncbi:hypothetical protein SLE2022_056340 [Rubroshorea leprosula]